MKKIISITLIITMFLTVSVPAFANVSMTSFEASKINSTVIYDQFGNEVSPEQVLEIMDRNNGGVFDESLIGPRLYSFRAYPKELEVYVPLLGLVTVLTSGAIKFMNKTYNKGTDIFEKAHEHLVYLAKKKTAEEAADDIPKRFKESDQVVDLDQFTDKHGNTPKTKSSGTFTNGRWKINKDGTGHTGYDGTKKKWKIWEGNDRIASLNKDGKVISN